ncbi:MAG TPA: lysophospholipid acyltransferase family protein [Bacteroidales bacterium]|nr:lysophospholipid acyltransferase family protein [Bacteroidales bacterium]
MSLIGAFLFITAVLIIGLLPVPVLYGLSSLFRFIIFRIIRYRTNLVEKNLGSSFPGITEEEIKRLALLFYKNLADIIIEGIWAFTISKKQILKRYRILNPEVLKPFSGSGKSLIGVTGHYSNWEWGSLAASMETDFNVIAFYKPMSNKYIDKFARWSRSRFGTTLVSINETSASFEKWKDSKTMFLMAADQGMPEKFLERAHWIRFLNHNTPFLHGMEKHGRLNNLPVIYIDVQRIRRGWYTVELSVLTTTPLELEEGQLTEMYAGKLESVILNKPENWLWSHNRFKFSR